MILCCLYNFPNSHSHCQSSASASANLLNILRCTRAIGHIPETKIKMNTNRMKKSHLRNNVESIVHLGLIVIQRTYKECKECKETKPCSTILRDENIDFLHELVLSGSKLVLLNLIRPQDPKLIVVSERNSI
jgi:hypothetical protein